MPLPKPEPNEKRKQFIQRCMIDPQVAVEYPNLDQRYALCIAQYNKQWVT